MTESRTGDIAWGSRRHGCRRSFAKEYLHVFSVLGFSSSTKDKPAISDESTVAMLDADTQQCRFREWFAY
jgi:hypothetical protein